MRLPSSLASQQPPLGYLLGSALVDRPIVVAAVVVVLAANRDIQLYLLLNLLDRLDIHIPAVGHHPARYLTALLRVGTVASPLTGRSATPHPNTA